MVGAFALTEAEAGSDAAGLRTTAVASGGALRPQRAEALHHQRADRGPLHRVRGDRARPGRARHHGVPRRAGNPGLEIGPINRMTGGRGSLHSEVVLKDCRVPAANVIGAPGTGFRTAMRCLNAGRVIWSAYSVGAAEHLLELAVDHLTRAASSGGPSPTTRGSSGSSPTWPPTSTRRGWSRATRPSATTRSPTAGRRSAPWPSSSPARWRSASPTGDAALRRRRILEGSADRAHLARRPRDPDPRRHLGDPADDRRATRARLGARLPSPGVE